ncbi:MAG: Anaerobic sulfatase-maturating enzyme [Dehalococcoidia bacterium]|nr:Anaerobic sulfatase-maturating enzyme [Bacillota bacterium]MBT9142256.1 Anaerobic sulfatase-maturating enzyme [Bacillota bacterium]
MPNVNVVAAPSRGRYINSGNGPTLQPIDIGHETYIGLVDSDTAFWALVKKDKLGQALSDSKLMTRYRRKAAAFAEEMEVLRFGLKPSAVYFNPTERCNLNCDYCYIPEEMRKNGKHMSEADIFKALAILRDYFKKTMPEDRLPQIVFHGSEPMLNHEAMFAAIEHYRGDFRFGVQTNGTLLDETAIDFLTSRNIGIGLSLDGHIAKIANRTRRNWSGQGSYTKVLAAMERLKGYQGYNIICTVTSKNLRVLSEIVDFFHTYEVPVCMLNPVRCTQPGAREVKPSDAMLAKHYMAALDRTYELYQQTGRKLVVANFANVLVSIIAPTARRLMCDISPCGGGRCFFALSANGDLFPCSEFIGLPDFNAGNIFSDDIEKALTTRAFTVITGRKVEDIEPCRRCAVRHFCGSPCPAEAHEMNGSMDRTGAFCELYEEQARYALRLIVDGKEDAYLWDGWDLGTTTTFNVSTV